MVWIGVEQFDAEHLFGDEGVHVYLWVPSDPALANALGIVAADLHHQPARSRTYVVKKRLQTLTQGEDPERLLSDLSTAIARAAKNRTAGSTSGSSMLG